jgi:hypothetical protein
VRRRRPRARGLHPCSAALGPARVRARGALQSGRTIGAIRDADVTAVVVRRWGVDAGAAAAEAAEQERAAAARAGGAQGFRFSEGSAGELRVYRQPQADRGAQLRPRAHAGAQRLWTDGAPPPGAPSALSSRGGAVHRAWLSDAAAAASPERAHPGLAAQDSGEASPQSTGLFRPATLRRGSGAEPGRNGVDDSAAWAAQEAVWAAQGGRGWALGGL